MRELLAFIGLLTLSVPDAELEKARAELKKALAEMSAGGVRDAADRLAHADQKAAVDALLDGYGTCATQIKALWADKVKALQQKEANADFRIDTKTNPPTIPKADEKKFLAYMEAEKSGQAIEAKIMNIEASKRAIVKALGRFKSEASIKELLKELAGNSNWQKRAGVAEALGQMPHNDIPPALAIAIGKDSEPQVRIAAMDAVAEQKSATPEIVAALIDQLRSDYWQVKCVAAATLRAVKARDAIEPLIEALQKHEGRLRIEFNDALVALTGVNKHGDYSAWKGWWEGNKQAVQNGTFKPRPEDAAGNQPRATTTFYGIPVESKSVIFILDRSGSMMEPSEWEVPPGDVSTGGGGPGGPDIKKTGDRKIDIARWQLKRSLAMMPDGADFNIIFFNHEWSILSDKILKLSASTRKQAFDWIDRLDPIGPTNSYDALEKALTFASADKMGEKIAKSGVDTIFFLTDGMPNSGQVPKADDIVVKIRELNKTRKVKINAIGIFSSPKVQNSLQPNEAVEGTKFLKQLADENGGKFTGTGNVQAPAKKP